MVSAVVEMRPDVWERRMAEDQQRNVRFAAYLQELRRQRGESQNTMADAAKISPTTFGHWMKGTTVPKPHTLKKVAENLNVSYEGLMRAAGHLQDDESDPPPLTPPAQRFTTYSEDEQSFWVETRERLYRLYRRTGDAVEGDVDLAGDVEQPTDPDAEIE